MMLHRDEIVGLVIAGVVASAALGTFIYRSTWGPVAPRAAPPAPAAPPEPRASQEARDTFADGLHQAFAQDGIDAAAVAQGTELQVRWLKCSKQMLRQLLDARDDALTRNLRELSGLSVARLRADGFTRIVCDDTHGRVTAEAIK